ncbi:MAG: isoprenylcysteine carboxylmethyltransferase family protein [Candidatus Bathyarchaeota archaeon]
MSSEISYGSWNLVFFNVAFFSAFLIFLPYRRKAPSNLLSRGAIFAFIVALFTEMYGFPLTIYALTWLFGYQNPLTHDSGHLLYPELGMLSPFHFLSLVMIGGGTLLVYLGWSKIYNAKALVADGIYAYARHPQYLGILLVMSGFLLQWVTIPTAIMFPILAMTYYRLAKREEKELEGLFGDEYNKYKTAVPMFLPLRIRSHSKSIIINKPQAGRDR